MLDSESEEYVKKLIHNAIVDHREMVEERMNLMHSDLSNMRGELNGLRGDVHNIGIATSDMRDSLKAIANSMESLADLPETWTKVKGFMAVVGWFRSNWFMFVLFGLLIFVSLHTAGFNVSFR